MKKIFVFLILMVVSFALKAQYPIQQNLGSDSTIIYIKGAARTVGGFINGTYTDTTAANLTRIRQYQAAQIFTTGDSAMWFRSVGATKWIRMNAGGGGSPTTDTFYWRTGGNYISDTGGYRGIIGTINNQPLIFGTNNQKRIILSQDGLQNLGTTNKGFMMYDTTTGVWSYATGGSGVYTAGYGLILNTNEFKADTATLFSAIRSTIPITTSLPISSLTAATGTNSINNGDYQQTWNWNSLSGYGFLVQSSATTASNGSRLLYVQRSGTNSNAGVTSYSGYFSNSHIGTSSTNIAGLFSAQSGTNNYAIIVPSGGGNVGFGTSTPNASALLDVSSTTKGAVLPRMNSTQMNAISSPVAGLMVYNSDSASYVFYNGTAWLKMGSGSGGGGTPGGSTKQFQYNNAGAFAGSSMLTQETDNISIYGIGNTNPFRVDGHEDLTTEIVNITQSGQKKFAFHSNGSIEIKESGATYNNLYSLNGSLYTTNDAGRVAQVVQTLQLTFGAGSGADGDTTAFTTSAIYGSFYNDADTIVVTSMRAVLQGTSPDVTYKVWYNDSLNVEAGATALVTAGSQVTNTTTGTNVTSFDVTKIPPGVWVWVKTSTVATKPKYFSLTLNGYRK